MTNKRDAKVFDDFESFLPKEFEKMLNSLRGDFRERAKRLKIIH